MIKRGWYRIMIFIAAARYDKLQVSITYFVDCVLFVYFVTRAFVYLCLFFFAGLMSNGFE